MPSAGTVRMLEKTPKNALRVPFFDAVWPDAEFIFLYRDARETLASMMEAWQSGYFRTYPRLPGWTGLPWSLLLVPGWQELNGLPLPQIVARQWAATIDVLVSDLETLPAERVRAVNYSDFLADPAEWSRNSLARWGSAGTGRSAVSFPSPGRPCRSRRRRNGGRSRASSRTIWPLVAEADAKAAASPRAAASD